MPARTVKINGKSYTVARMPLRAIRELDDLESEAMALAAEVDGLDAQIGSIQQRLLALAEEGTATPEAVKDLTDQEAALGNRRRLVGWDQMDLRIRRLAVRLEGVMADELADLIDVAGGELGDLEEQLGRPFGQNQES